MSAYWFPKWGASCSKTWLRYPCIHRRDSILIIYTDPERGGFGVIFPEVMIFSEGLCPEENIITEGNIADSPSGGSINDIP
jgi:hypothetical protein